VKELVHVKDKINQKERVGVVYRIPCSQCHLCCIGETGNILYVIKTGNINNATVKHAWEAGHFPELN